MIVVRKRRKNTLRKSEGKESFGEGIMLGRGTGRTEEARLYLRGE